MNYNRWRSIRSVGGGEEEDAVNHYKEFRGNSSNSSTYSGDLFYH